MWLILPARTRKKDYAPRRFRRASFHVGGALGDNIPLRWRISDFTRPRTWERRAAAGKRLVGLFFGNGGTRAKVASAFIGFFLFLWRLTPQEKQLDVRTTEENDCSIWFNRDEDVFRPPPSSTPDNIPTPKTTQSTFTNTDKADNRSSHLQISAAKTMGADSETP